MMIKILKENKRRTFQWVVFSLFILYMCVGLLTHEHWRDEAQSFLLIKNLSFSQIFQQLKYEGHPIVWYAILYPFIKMGCPIIIQNILSAFFASLSTYLFLFKSPFRNNLKLIFLLTTPLLFSYSVIGRSYCIVLLFLVIILTIFEERYSKNFVLYALSLALLINTSLYSAIIAGAFIASDIIMLFLQKELKRLITKEFIIVFFLFIASTIFLFATIFPGNYYNIYVQQNTQQGALFGFLKIFYNAFPTAYTIATLIKIPSLLSFTMLAAVSLSAFMFGLSYPAIISKNIKNMYAIIFFCIFLLALFVLVLFTSRFNSQNGGIVVLVIMSVIWLFSVTDRTLQKTAKQFMVAFTVVFIMFSSYEMAIAVSDISKPYSGSKDVAAFLIDNGYDKSDTLLITTDAPHASGILVQLKNIKQTKSIDGYMSFVDWGVWHNTEEEPISYFNFSNIIGDDAEKYIHIILIADSTRISSDESLPYKEIYSSSGADKKAMLENFKVYMIK